MTTMMERADARKAPAAVLVIRHAGGDWDRTTDLEYALDSVDELEHEGYYGPAVYLEWDPTSRIAERFYALQPEAVADRAGEFSRRLLDGGTLYDPRAFVKAGRYAAELRWYAEMADDGATYKREMAQADRLERLAWDGLVEALR